MTPDIPTEDFRAKTYDVFISYRHLDAEIRDIVVEALQAANLSVWWDAKLVSGLFRSQLASRINNCKLVVALWTKQVEAAPDEVRDEMSQARGLDRLMVLRTDAAEIPKLFGEQNFMTFDGWAAPLKRKAELDAIVTEVRRRIAAPSYQVVETGKANTATTFTAPPEFGDIPGAPDKLIGRDAEQAMLRDAWSSRPPKKVNAVVLHALGGAGKSALLRTFANELLAASGGGASRIYGWSAYSQGSGEQKRADADGFISKALGDFGWQGELPKDPVERARELAKLIQKERVLLLLDGLEPLQDVPSLNKGRFKDKGLAELIKLLAAQNQGLMVLTTRQEVPELGGFGPLVINHALEDLSDRAGAELLVELGVTGRQRDLEAAVREVEGHALSVTLLGTYLAEICGGDIRHRDQFNFADVVLSPEENDLADKTIIPAKRAAKVMRAYLEQFEKLASDPKQQAEGLGGPERDLLNLIGLFDRPADGPAVDALLAQHIPGLTDELFFERIEKASDGQFGAGKMDLEPLPDAKRTARIRDAKRRLRKLRLLAKANPKDPHELDAHPVVRAFFAGRLDKTAHEAAKAAHDILYRHYAAAGLDLPNTLDEMQPLLNAVRHGMKAGRAQETYDEIYMRRINRGSQEYIVRLLGATCADLAAMANFFEVPWSAPHQALNSTSQAWLLTMAAWTLTVLGRLRDAVEPQRVGLQRQIVLEDWVKAAISAGNLSDTLLTLGAVRESVAAAESAVEYSDRGDNARYRVWLRANQAAGANLAAGRRSRATDLIREAQTRLPSIGLHLSELPGIPGYVQGDVILASGMAQEALDRGWFLLDLAQKEFGRSLGLHDIGFAWLLIGRAQDELGHQKASASLDSAVESLRKSGQEQWIPKALLSRAAHHRKRVAAGDAELLGPLRGDLGEVEDIAGEEMRLYLTDLALERARLALDVPSAFTSPEAARAEAQAQTAKAAALIAETGYHRRDGELAELKARLAAS